MFIDIVGATSQGLILLMTGVNNKDILPRKAFLPMVRIEFEVIRFRDAVEIIMSSSIHVASTLLNLLFTGQFEPPGLYPSDYVMVPNFIR